MTPNADRRTDSFSALYSRWFLGSYWLTRVVKGDFVVYSSTVNGLTSQGFSNRMQIHENFEA